MKRIAFALIIALTVFAFHCFGQAVVRRAMYPAAGGGSVAFDAASSQSYIGNTPTTLAHTASGSNRLLMVAVKGSSDVTGVTYNGVAMTMYGSADSSGTTVTVYYLTAPASGTNNVEVSFTGPPGVYLISALSFTGVNQTTPLGTAVTASGFDAAPTTTVSSATGEMIFEALAFNALSSQNGSTPGSGQTQRTGLVEPDAFAGYTSTEVGAASVTVNWTLEASRTWAIVAGAVKPA